MSADTTGARNPVGSQGWGLGAVPPPPNPFELFQQGAPLPHLGARPLTPGLPVVPEFVGVTLDPVEASAEPQFGRPFSSPAPACEQGFTRWWCRRASGAKESSAPGQVGKGWKLA